MSALLQRFALFYPMRIVGTTFMVVVTTLYAWEFDRFVEEWPDVEFAAVRERN